ncbi:hypothetical protein FLONG3_6760 [Fusarium longipes]|uniref:Uncharacterized protein n=1 Tax=Fusarium longipes TaxID=694270 RepID=A0A395SIT1_9HYPO|nr:hypothetical protein FLONG3_6760 [Fusarium longipes]
MAQMLAPYNNSMRLGQGFNSYTQQVCLDKAVIPSPPKPPKTQGIITLASSVSSGTASQDGQGNGAIEDGKENNDTSVATPAKKPDITHPIQVMPWVKPQIVTYSSRFVDKLSDITDAMNISGALSINTATIGGTANGSYVDSDKFKSSDINFHLQVKVTNQLHDATEYDHFNKIDNVKEKDFPEVYGDSFISGWEEGGELNAVISMKVLDKAKVFEIKAKLEGELKQPTVQGKLQAEADITKNNLSQSTETTISVTWSGGGSIKDPTEDWNIASLKKAAAAFPDLVAITPQRTYAILTKYTSLASFHEQNLKFSPLDYESAGIYTRALMDSYMDYKAMWKQISHATYELKGNRATIEMAKPDEETCSLAVIEHMPVPEDKKKLEDKNEPEDKETRQARAAIQARAVTSLTGAAAAKDLVKLDSQSSDLDAKSLVSQDIRYKVFSPSFAGLIHARKVCRFEMAKIVNEVDLVTKNPKISSDTTRDAYFLNPLIFEQLLPIVHSSDPEFQKRGTKDPNASLLLGYIPPLLETDAFPSIFKLEYPIEDHAAELQSSLHRNAWMAQEYMVEGCAGAYKKDDVRSTALLKNDLEQLNATSRPTRFSVWIAKGIVQGICTTYSNKTELRHGTCDGEPTHVLDLDANGSEIVVEVVVRETVNSAGNHVIASIAMSTSKCKTFDTQGLPSDKKDSDSKSKEDTTKAIEPTKPSTEKPTQPETLPQVSSVHTWIRQENAQWSLRGFFTFSRAAEPGTPPVPCTLGVVWGKDTFVPKPMASIVPPLSKNFLGFSPSLQTNIQEFQKLKNYSKYADKFLMGRSVSAKLENNEGVTSFNCLNTIDISWKPYRIAFTSKAGRLTGLSVWYPNQSKPLVHGVCEEKPTWTCEIKSDLVVVKLSAGRTQPSGDGYIDTVEFIRADEGGKQSAWPLYVSTLRYCGQGDKRVSLDVSEVIEEAPAIGGNSKWTIRGFFGEERKGVITRLGVVWGRG